VITDQYFAGCVKCMYLFSLFYLLIYFVTERTKSTLYEAL